MKIETYADFEKLQVGKKVYFVSNGNVDSHYYAGINPASDNYRMFVNGYDVSQGFSVYVREEQPVGNIFDNYEEAKEELWKQTVDRVKVINNIYFNNIKDMNLNEE